LLFGLFVVLSTHSAYVRYHTWSGRRAHAAALEHAAGFNAQAISAIDHLDKARHWGLLYVPENDRIAAELLGRQGHWGEAEKLYRTVRAWRPSDRVANVGLAQAAIQQRHYAEAVALLQAELARAGPDALLLYQLAGSLHALGNIPGALQALRDSVRIKPDSARVQRDLGATLLELGDMHGAFEHLRRAVELEPQNSEGHYNLALAYWIVGVYDDARREIDAALTLSPADDQTRRLRVLMHDGSGRK
jgi:Flp pilus assembly protein TadD